MRRALVIVGKAPAAGVTKTRLTPPLTPAQAARLYRGFLQDTAATALTLNAERTTLIYPPSPGAAETLSELLPAGVCLKPQPGEGLGAALAGAFRDHLAAGFDRVVLIGSDNPTLPAQVIEEAYAGLHSYDVVIGPSTDGGYYMIGMTRPHLSLFERIDWSTEIVYAQTLERAREMGLRVLPVQEWYDVDTVTELARLRADLTALPSTVAPATRAALAEIRAL